MTSIRACAAEAAGIVLGRKPDSHLGKPTGNKPTQPWQQQSKRKADDTKDHDSEEADRVRRLKAKGRYVS